MLEKSNDKNYPYKIVGGWGDVVYLCEESILELYEELKIVVDEILKTEKD